MGDRGNVVCYDGRGNVWFYTHWRGSELPELIKTALQNGKDRWDDPQYLNRIIFSEIVKGDEDDTDGYGISSFIGDNENPIVRVNHKERTVVVGNKSLESFEEFTK